ncbi:MAG: hypothetical protein EZS28_035268 [Streblomastix strix]|uniref:Uncharacterized protein n=1 Tax=Streblomastix strix TaxID=222440 RepID=A0A5J4UEL3_9EUKA|nr:MAG: hypothetical protein EZS28_035268 [Streblomastix strix]
MDSNNRDHKEKRRLAEDPGLSNSEQRVVNRVFQTRRDYRYSGNNTTQRLGNNNRPASSLPSHQSSRRDATNAVWSFNGTENLYQMPPTTNSRNQKAMQLENLRLCRRYSDPELGSHNITTRDIASNDDSTGVWINDRNGQEPDQSHADSRVLGLAVEHESNDNVNDNISKERSLEIAKHLMKLTMRRKHERTRDLASLQKLKNKEAASRDWNKWTQLNKSAIPDITWRINKLAHNQPLCFTKPNRWIMIQIDASSSGLVATLIRENQEKVFVHGEWKDNNLKSSNQREVSAVLKSLLEFCQELILQQRVGTLLLTDNTVTMYCFNKGKGSITIAPLVDKVLKLAEQYNWIIEASHILGLSNTISDSLSRLSRCGNYAIKKEIFQKMLKELGIQISTDIFVTRANRQYTRYCSISIDKCAVKRNGFSLEWAKEIPLLHPPIFQLLKAIKKVKQERVSLAVLIAPDQPNQKWFTELREITRQKICLGESTQVLLIGAKH